MKYLFAFLLSLSLLAAPAAAQEVYSEPIDFQAMASQAGASAAFFTLPGTGSFDSDEANYGHQLDVDPVAQRAYAALEEDLAPGVDMVFIDLSGLLPLDWESEVIPGLKAAVSAYVFDHPESQYCSITSLNLSGSTASYTVEQSSNAARRKAALDDAVEAFLDVFDDSLSPAEQCRFIHDYVCKSTSYDYDTATSGVFSQAHTAYGALVDGRDVVCEGYSKAFKVLCDAAGIPCMLIAGSSFDISNPDLEKTNHMWNAVRIDGDWYAIDVTWDDAADNYALDSIPGLTISFPSYTYFMDNDLFLDGSDTQDHHATGNIYYVSDFPMTYALPELADGQHPEAADMIPEELVLTLTGSSLTVPDQLWRYSVDNVLLRDIPNVTLQLTQDATLSATVSVPEHKTYTVSSAGQAVYTVSHAPSFQSALFSVAGELVLGNVAVDDGDTILPLLTLAPGGTFTDAADPDLAGYLNYSGTETGEATGFQASYDQHGRMLGLTQLGTFELTTPAIYSFGMQPRTAAAAHTVKQFLLSPETMVPVSSCILNP